MAQTLNPPTSRPLPGGEIYWARPLMVAAMVAISSQLGRQAAPGREPPRDHKVEGFHQPG